MELSDIIQPQITSGDLIASYLTKDLTTDGSGNGFTLTTGSASSKTFTKGIISKEQIFWGKFDGSTEYLQRDNSSDTILKNVFINGFSVSFEFKLNRVTGTDQEILAFTEDLSPASTESRIRFIVGSSTLAILLSEGGNYLQFTVPVSINKAYHIVFTISPSEANQIFVNSEKINPTYSIGSSATVLVASTINYTSIGRLQSGINYTDGFIRNVKLYSDVLSNKDITELFYNSSVA